MGEKARCRVNTQAHIRAPAEKVWAALLEPERIQQWWGTSRGLVEPRKGGLWALAWGDAGQGYRYVLSGIIRVIKPGLRLRIEPVVYFNPERAPLGPMRVSFSLREKDGVTRLTVRQEANGEGPDWDWYLGVVKQGWKDTLSNLKNHLEKGG